jgi:hypothetical protein
LGAVTFITIIGEDGADLFLEKFDPDGVIGCVD